MPGAGSVPLPGTLPPLTGVMPQQMAPSQMAPSQMAGMVPPMGGQGGMNGTPPPAPAEAFAQAGGGQGPTWQNYQAMFNWQQQQQQRQQQQASVGTPKHPIVTSYNIL
eukprot:693165-Pyramimonas_sp.AAC.1